jgi:hypothetical protein
MKKTICIGSIVLLCSFIFLSLIGCDAHNHAACFMSIQKEFPNSQICVVDRNGYRFVVKDKDGLIWYVETRNYTNTNISLKQKLF